MSSLTGAREEKKTGGTGSMIWVLVAFLLSKGAVILKALKALKYAKFLITAITMSLSAILYGFAFGSWYFAAGLVLLLLVHEYGHVLAMWRKGVHASAPVFIPFLGAAIFAQIPENKDDEAYIGYGGPLIGTIGSLACIAVAFMLEHGTFWSVLLHVLGNVGLFINLFNLIPARPLDGGRILHPLGRGVVYCGLAILLLLAYVLQDLVFVFIALLSVDENMPVRAWVRRSLWGFLWATLSFLVAFPTGLTGIVSLLVFLLLAFFCGLAFWWAWEARHEPLHVVASDAEDVPVSIKVKWMVLYAALLAGIAGAMVWHSGHLPKEVHDSPLMRFVHEL